MQVDGDSFKVAGKAGGNGRYRPPAHFWTGRSLGAVRNAHRGGRKAGVSMKMLLRRQPQRCSPLEKVLHRPQAQSSPLQNERDHLQGDNDISHPAKGLAQSGCPQGDQISPISLPHIKYTNACGLLRDYRNMHLVNSRPLPGPEDSRVREAQTLPSGTTGSNGEGQSNM